MQATVIVALSILAASIYGVLHNQVTARICVEFFTIGHPRLFPTDSPTLLGIGWGIISTWWVGLILGGGLALAAQVGDRPKRNARSLIRPIVILFAVTAAFAALAGAIGYVVASNGWMVLVEPLASQVPPEKHVAFLVDGFAHGASYLVGFVGGLVVVIQTWRSRALAPG
ncbi:MAG: hypothetical protein L0Z62_25630 [Gemmataceae bacterium]|nr:hypothetical protein [Gemmataceae bacterium]